MDAYYIKNAEWRIKNLMYIGSRSAERLSIKELADNETCILEEEAYSYDERNWVQRGYSDNRLRRLAEFYVAQIEYLDDAIKEWFAVQISKARKNDGETCQLSIAEILDLQEELSHRTKYATSRERTANYYKVIKRAQSALDYLPDEALSRTAPEGGRLCRFCAIAYKGSHKENHTEDCPIGMLFRA